MELLEMLQQASQQKRVRQTVIAVGGAVLTMILIVVGLFFMLNGQREANKKLEDELTTLKTQLVEAEKIDVAYIGNKLETISELTTAKMTYNGIIHWSEGKIAFIDKKEFYMAYRVSLKAGFDFDKVDIQVTDVAVIITLPEAEIYEPVVDEKSFQFFDKNYGIFAHEEMTDLSEAITRAKEDALAQPETEAMKETAKEQAVILIRALFEGMIGQRELIVNIQ